MRKLYLLVLLTLFPSVCWPAPVNFTGFETGDSSELKAPVTGTASIWTTSPRTGTYSLRVNPSDGTASYAEICCVAADGSPADCNASAMYVRWYFNPQTISSDAEKVIEFQSSGSTTVAFLTLQSAGTLFKLFNAGFSQAQTYDYSTFSGGFTSGTYYRMELFLNQSGDAWTMKINGTQVMNGSGTDFGTNDIDCIKLGKVSNLNSAAIDFRYDDVNMDTASFPGAGSVTALVPNANGATHQFTSGTGTSGFDEIDEIPYSDADYVATDGTINYVSRFGIKTLDGTSSIAAVKALARMKEASSSTGSQVGFYSNTTESITSAANPSTTFTYYAKIASVDPATSSAWTEGGLDALQLEVKQSTAVVGTVSHGLIMVDHVGGSVLDDAAAAFKRKKNPMNGGFQDLNGGL